jgi:hypothetical protein
MWDDLFKISHTRRNLDNALPFTSLESALRAREPQGLV